MLASPGIISQKFSNFVNKLLKLSYTKLVDFTNLKQIIIINPSLTLIYRVTSKSSFTLLTEYKPDLTTRCEVHLVSEATDDQLVHHITPVPQLFVLLLLNLIWCVQAGMMN